MNQLGSLPKTVQVGQYNLRIDRQLAEGGFGFVYAVTDTASHQQFALKQMNIQNDETKRLIDNEIRVWVSKMTACSLFSLETTRWP